MRWRPSQIEDMGQTDPRPRRRARIVIVHAHEEPRERRIGTGLDMDSFQVVADFTLDGIAAGQNLASKFAAKSAGVWEWTRARPLTELPRGKLTVSVRDRQGNVTRIERTFGVGSLGAGQPSR